MDGLTPELVAKLANSGEAIAQKLWDSFGTYLGIGIASLINVLGITTFIIGGGIAGSWRLFEEATKASIARHTYEENVKSLIITPSRLGNDAGIIGAVLAALSLVGCHRRRRDR